jgi:bifunctional UDP-N-acetylglucosamine pyrophosphorylase/glucosamine-1-phosphate N-acetyltransferase
MIAASTLKQLVEEHRSSGAAVSVLSVVLDNPCGYGRILRNEEGSVYGIMEERDASAEQRSISEINTGIYCCTASFLFDALKHIGTDNDQGEYYLPDIVSVAAQRRLTVNAIITPDPEEVAGINDRAALARAEKCMRGRILKAHMDSGVTIIDPDSTYIDTGVRIGRDTVVFPNSHIAGSTEIGSACRIEISCCVRDSLLGDGVHLRPSCVLDRCHVKDHAIIGPFAHLRPDALVEPEAHIGNFVEVKKSVIGKGSKANHLTYIGDATIGEGANIGAGTITCNYDGKHKHPTVIRDGAFIGSNTALVAPVTVGRNAVVGAGSTITKNVPEDSLSVARGRQRNYENFFKKKGSRGDTEK